MYPAGVPAFDATTSLAADHDQKHDTEASDNLRRRLLLLVDSGYSFHDANSKPLSKEELPTPQRLVETEQLHRVWGGKVMRINKAKLGQLLSRKYDLLLRPVQPKKPREILSNPEKIYLDERKQEHGASHLYDTLDALSRSIEHKGEDELDDDDDDDGTNFEEGPSIARRDGPLIGQRPEVDATSSGESDIDEPKSKIFKPKATGPRQDDVRDIRDNSGNLSLYMQYTLLPEQSASKSYNFQDSPMTMQIMRNEPLVIRRLHMIW